MREGLPGGLSTHTSSTRTSYQERLSSSFICKPPPTWERLQPETWRCLTEGLGQWWEVEASTGTGKGPAPRQQGRRNTEQRSVQKWQEPMPRRDFLIHSFPSEVTWLLRKQPGSEDDCVKTGRDWRRAATGQEAPRLPAPEAGRGRKEVFLSHCWYFRFKSGHVPRKIWNITGPQCTRS